MGMTRSNPVGMKTKKSRGRPKLHRERIDRGTAELQAKKKILVGTQPPALQDLSQTLNLLYHRKAITGEQLKAGQAYQGLGEEIRRFWSASSLNRSSLVGIGDAKGTYSPWNQAGQIPEHKEYRRWRWTYVQSLLAQEGIKVQHLVYRVVLNNYITPEMIQEDVPPPLELKLLRRGLDVVYRFFYGRPAAAAAPLKQGPA